MSGGRHPRYGAAWSGGYTPTDPDAAAYIAAVEAVGGEPAMSDFMKEAVDDFYIKLKTDGNFGTNLELHVYGVAQTLAGGLIPMKGTTGTNVGGNLVGADYDRTKGIEGNGVNKGVLVSTSRSGTNYEDNLFACCAITKGSGEQGPGLWARLNSNSQRTIAVIKRNDNFAGFYFNGASSITSSDTVANDLEYLAVVKETSSTNANYTSSVGSGSIGLSDQTAGTVNIVMGIQCRTDNGSITDYDLGFTRVAAWGYSSEMGTAADFYDAVAALLTAIDTDAA